MSNEINKETVYTASITSNNGLDSNNSSITTTDVVELARFLKLAGVNTSDAVGSCDICSSNEGWSDESPVNMNASGFKTGGDVIDVELPIEETGQAEFDYKYNDSDGEVFGTNVYDYKGRGEHFPGGANYRRVNNYGDNALPQEEEVVEASNYADPHGGSMISPYNDELDDTEVDSMYDNVKDEVHTIIKKLYDDVLVSQEVFMQHYDMEDLEPLADEIASDAIGAASRLYGDGDEYHDYVDQKEIAEYVLGIMKSKLGINEEEIGEDISRIKELAGIPVSEKKKPDADGDSVPDWADKKPGEDDLAEDEDEPSVEVGQYVKINPSVGGGYGQVKSFSPSGKFVVVEIVGEGEYDIDDEAGMPDLTGETLHYHLSDLIPLASYDAMVDMIDADKEIGEGYTARELTDHDREWLSRTIPGLEGPFRNRMDGKYYYYDPKEGRYYDSTVDMYMDRDFVLEKDDIDGAIWWGGSKQATRARQKRDGRNWRKYITPTADDFSRMAASKIEKGKEVDDTEPTPALAQSGLGNFLTARERMEAVIAGKHDLGRDLTDSERSLLQTMRREVYQSLDTSYKGRGNQEKLAKADAITTLLGEAKARGPNNREDTMMNRIAQKQEKGGFSKYIPTEVKKSDDKYAALAKKYGIKDESVDELEARLAEKFNSFLGEFGRRSVEQRPDFANLLNDFIDFLATNLNKEEAAQVFAKQNGGDEKMVAALLKHTSTLTRDDIDRRARHQD